MSIARMLGALAIAGVVGAGARGALPETQQHLSFTGRVACLVAKHESRGR